MSAETQAERDAADCTVVCCRSCHKVNTLCVTSHIDAEFESELGRMVKAGCSVKHMPVIYARDQEWCSC